MPTQRGNRRAGAQTRQAARVPEQLEPASDDLISDSCLEKVHITGDVGEPDGAILTDVELADLRWTGARLTGRRFRRLHCRDVVFDNCDLSGVIMDDSGLKRVEFHECRMSGIVLAGSTLEDVLFSECRLDSANLRMVHGRRLDFLGSDLRQADLYGAELVATRIQDGSLSFADFSQASAQGIRLHGCDLRELKGVSALDGAVIGRDQVMDLALALFDASGITVDDKK
jgi:uncharacterized protein YjbI with pentapeptide repeats